MEIRRAEQQSEGCKAYGKAVSAFLSAAGDIFLCRGCGWKGAGSYSGRSKKSVPKFALRRTLAQLWSIALLFTTKTGRGIGKFFSTFDQTDEELLKNAGNAFDAEICFFAVDESTRGTGIGKMLFAKALDYLEQEGTKTLYLFTDSSCTYQFYEKRGMQRLGEKTVEFSPHTDYRLNMFIYGLELQAAS